MCIAHAILQRSDKASVALIEKGGLCAGATGAGVLFLLASAPSLTPAFKSALIGCCMLHGESILQGWAHPRSCKRSLPVLLREAG